MGLPHLMFLSKLPLLLLAHAAISKIDLALEQGDTLALYEALTTPALGLRGLLRENCDWYFKQFLSDRQQKQEVWKSLDYPDACMKFSLCPLPFNILLYTNHLLYTCITV